MMRKVEQRFGPRKFFSRLLLIISIAIGYQLAFSHGASLRKQFQYLAIGPFCIIASILPDYFLEIPTLPGSKIFGVDGFKGITYFLAFSFFMANHFSSLLPAFTGVLAWATIKTLPFLSGFRIPRFLWDPVSTGILKVFDVLKKCLFAQPQQNGAQQPQQNEQAQADPNVVAQLMTMGVQESAARQAAIRANNNLEQALALLF